MINSLPSSNEPIYWPRGGDWELEWEGVEHQRDEKAWGLYDGAWVYKQKDEGNADLYDPFKDEPNAYLEFSALGELGWTAYSGRFLSELSLDPLIPDDVKPVAKRFLEKYGPLLSREKTQFLWQRSLHTMIRQAQLVRLNIVYQQASTFETDMEELRGKLKAALDTLSFDSPAWNELRLGHDLSKDEVVVDVAEWLFNDLSWRDLGLGGLHPVLDRAKDEELGAAWGFTFRYDHLLNVLWYQTYQAMVNHSLIRVCQNERCPRPGQLFDADRTNKKYCSIRCRNHQGVITSRRKTRR